MLLAVEQHSDLFEVGTGEGTLIRLCTGRQNVDDILLVFVLSNVAVVVVVSFCCLNGRGRL